MGILVAEQIRFNTLDIEYEHLTTLPPNTLFEFMYNSYKTLVYNDWKGNEKG